MEHIKQVYDEIIEESHKKNSSGGIDFSALKEFEIDKLSRLILRKFECKEIGIDTDTDPIYQAILHEHAKQTERPKRITKEEKHILIAKKIKNINLNEGEVLPCKLSSYYINYKYTDLSFEEFCSYLYWRTQIRKKQILQAPIPYLWLYLSELRNLVEFDTLEETSDMLYFLLSTQQHKRAKDIIQETISNIIVY